uniref:Rrm/rnp domain n=2 Tax=Eukaryota TaxID=2759 RepID=M1AY34_SOLTU
MSLQLQSSLQMLMGNPLQTVVWLVPRKEAGQGMVNLKIKKEEKKNEDPSQAEFCIWLTVGSIRLIMMMVGFQSCTAR